MPRHRWAFAAGPVLVAGILGVTVGTAAAAAAPVADAGGPYTVNEGSGVTLDGTASTAGPTATFEWDLDGDGQFDDATGANPTVTASTLASLGLGDGPAGPVIVSLRVTDDATSNVDTTTLTVFNVAPVASVTNVPSGVAAGTPAPVSFAATDASAADTAAGFTFRIDWGDGTPVQSVTGGSSVMAIHAWATSATFTVSVTATDKDAGTSAAATALVPVDPLVVADAGGPYTANEGAAVSLDATASTAGPTATYQWDVDNDGQFDDATGVNPTVSAATLAMLGLGDGPAVTTVSVRVTEGLSSSLDTSTLTLVNVAPVASAPAAPAGVVAGVPAMVQFSALDVSGADTAAGFAFAINWGDGTPVQSVFGGASITVSHTWSTNGTFTVSVTATDKDGATSAAATALVPVGAAPAADAGGPYTVNEGSGVTLDGTGTTAGPTATFEWDVDGDGQFDDATGPNPTLSAGMLATLGLGDGPAGPVVVSLRVTEGLATGVDATTLTVVNVAPVASVTSVPSGVMPGVPASMGFSADDASAADDAAGFTFAINWGDGTPVQSVTGGASVTALHVWSTNGTFTVSVTATDKDGATSAAATATVTVGPVPPVLAAEAGGPYTIAEGANLVLAGSATGAGPGATFAWDLDGDGQFDDATGATPTLTPNQLAALGLADGPAGPVVLTLKVTDGTSVDTDPATYSITNAAPSATVDLPAAIVAGTTTTVKFGAQDPSPTDQAGQFEYRIDWNGDGVVDDIVSGPADPPVNHTYGSAGTFSLSVVAVDKDGGASAPTVVRVTVGSAGAGGLVTTGTRTMPVVVTAVALILAGLIVLLGVRFRPYAWIRRRVTGS